MSLPACQNVGAISVSVYAQPKGESTGNGAATGGLGDVARPEHGRQAQSNLSLWQPESLTVGKDNTLSSNARVAARPRILALPLRLPYDRNRLLDVVSAGTSAYPGPTPCFNDRSLAFLQTRRPFRRGTADVRWQTKARAFVEDRISRTRRCPRDRSAGRFDRLRRLRRNPRAHSQERHRGNLQGAATHHAS
ncbi:hypothetical protein ACVI1J_001159 [Bradyrhizobium diazoefficiens]|uniref:Blr5985 protein n=1 Tax=Bradyrhizobium diazoefficiens (strain JCM 10833 / BCRC 13528 / IAM 13628 / NBRC 14792 / USDA 110) TaxID=224911 RepID=Q89HK5_BRADU|nr:blr5985 [Bradyrhizobium diazoefficiens USDA 110]